MLGVPLTDFHKQELLLSIAMTVYGATTLLKRRFTALNALTLFGLWLVQFMFPVHLPGTSLETRFLTSLAFAGLSVVEFLRHRSEIHILRDLHDALSQMLVRRESAPTPPSSSVIGDPRDPA